MKKQKAKGIKYQKKLKLEGTFEQVIGGFMNVPPKNQQKLQKKGIKA